MRRFLVPILALSLAACQADAPPAASTATSASASQSGAHGDATSEMRVGDAVVNASVVQTSMLPESVAREHGIERSDRLAMLLVNVRGRDGGAPPPGLEVSATVAPDSATPQPLVLRAVQAGDSLDRVGTVEIAPPEHLRFEVTVRYGTATSSMQLDREFFPH